MAKLRHSARLLPSDTSAEWRGLLAGLLCVGAGAWLSGSKRKALLIWAGFTLLPPLCVLALIWPQVPPIFPWYAASFAVFFFLLNLLASWRPVPKLSWKTWVALPLLALTSGLFFRVAATLFFEGLIMPSNAMSPTLQAEDRILLDRTAYWKSTPQRGDVIGFETTGIPQFEAKTLLVKRVAALPGETISIGPEGLKINGSPISYPGRAMPLPTGNFLTLPNETFQVPEGQIFVLGDNPSNSLDSRSFGPVPLANVQGRVSVCYYPANRINRVR